MAGGFALFSFSNVEIINKEVASFDYSQHNAHRSSCYVSDTMNLLKILREKVHTSLVKEKKNEPNCFSLSFANSPTHSIAFCCISFVCLFVFVHYSNFCFHFVNYSGF